MVAKRKKKIKQRKTRNASKPNQLANLAKLTAVEMIGFIVLELILWLLVIADLIPHSIIIKKVGLLEISMNTGYFVVVGLVAVLVASFWIAILVQFGIIKIENIDFKL